MGIYVFFSILVLSLISFLVYVVKNIKPKNETKGETRKKDTASKPKGRLLGSLGEYLEIMAAFMPTILVLLVILGLFWLSMIHHDKNHSQPVMAAVVQQTDSRNATLFWEKIANETGKNPGEKSLQVDAVVSRNDEKEMKFTASRMYGGENHEATFRWNKQEKIGTWSQYNPKDPSKIEDSGVWFLIPSAESEKVFVGRVSDSVGTVAQLKLELKS
jgi:uncharacterized membrane protein